MTRANNVNWSIPNMFEIFHIISSFKFQILFTTFNSNDEIESLISVFYSFSSYESDFRSSKGPRHFNYIQRWQCLYLFYVNSLFSTKIYLLLTLFFHKMIVGGGQKYCAYWKYNITMYRNLKTGRFNLYPFLRRCTCTELFSLVHQRRAHDHSKQIFTLMIEFFTANANKKFDEL